MSTKALEQPAELPALIPLRQAARRLSMPGTDLLAALEERGAEVYRLGGRGRRARYRIRAEDVLALLQESRRPTASQARTRSQAIKEMVESEVLGEHRSIGRARGPS